MTMYAISSVFDKNGDNLFKSIAVTDADRKRYMSWCLDHQKGREHVRSSFGVTHFRWSPFDPLKMPIADYPCSGFPSGMFSKRAVDLLRERLLAHGDIHPLKMDDGADYSLFDCWTRITSSSFVSSGVCDGGIIKSMTVPTGTELPDLFMLNKSARLIVDEAFKDLAESAGLTGMVFSPVEIVFAD